MRRATDLLVARLRFRWGSTTFYQYVGLSILTPDSLHPESGDRDGAAVCSQQPITPPTHHPSFLIMRRRVIRPESKPRPGCTQLVGLAGRVGGLL